MDTSTVPKSWQEAFESHSIPAVRAFEKQLRSSVNRDKEKLRVLVGGNYRELLSTAEEIVVLEQNTRNAETSISELSQQCKPPVDRKVLEKPVKASQAAQLRLLVQCLACASSALRVHSLLGSAQLVVISRLLLKSLTDQETHAKSLEQLRSRETSIRRTLLRRIDGQLVNPRSSLKLMVQALSAYCLFTSASSSDALKHFRKLRLDRLRQRSQDREITNALLYESFRYFVASIKSLKSLLGRPINEAISNLQKQPIFDDPAIKGIESLNVETYASLIPRDITSFTPYIKRVTLSQAEVDELVQSWSTEAAEILVGQLSECLQRSRHLNDVLELRKETLRTLLQDYFSIGAPENALMALRECLNSQIIQLCHSQIVSLGSIAEAMAEMKCEDTSPPTWEVQMVQRPWEKNSTKYCYQVQSRHHGTEGELHVLLKKLQLWSKHTLRIRDRVNGLSSIRWQDIIEEPDEEEEDVVREIKTGLGKEDPDKFVKSNDTALEEAVAKFEQIVSEKASKALALPDDELVDSGYGKVVFSLRIIRESSLIIRRVSPKAQFEKLFVLIPHLHEKIANVVIRKLAVACEKDEPSNGRLSVTLEDLPSPQTFTNLQKLCSIMSDVGGSDIWSPAAVAAVKRAISNHVFEEAYLKYYAVNEFDKRYLQIAFEWKSSTKLNGGDGAQRVTDRQASACWNRTKALFGMLNP